MAIDEETQMQEQRPKLLTEYEAAEILNVAVSWFRHDRLREGKNLVPYLRIGGRVRYDENDLLQFIRDSRNKQSNQKNKKIF